MDWTTVITTLIGSGLIVTVGGYFAYRKFLKSIKASEAKNADTEAQKNQIDLSMKFATDMLSLMEQVKKATQTSDSNQQTILRKIDRVEYTLTNVVDYLNGPFQEFQSQREARIKELEQ